MYGEICIYRPLKSITLRERASARSKVTGELSPGTKIYIDRIRRNWGRICYIRNEYIIGGDLVHNGQWIPLDENVVIVWAKGREIEKRQQEVSA